MNYAVSFNPDEEELSDVLAAVSWIYGYASVEEAVADAVAEDAVEAAEPRQAAAPGGWTLQKMRRYVLVLQPNAQQVLGIVAHHAPEITVEETQRLVGLDAGVYAGSMSSFGFAARKTRGVKSRPFEKVRRSYQMNPEIAKLALEALDELGLS